MQSWSIQIVMGTSGSRRWRRAVWREEVIRRERVVVVPLGRVEMTLME